MKFATLASLCFGVSLASPGWEWSNAVVKRDGTSVIETALYNISNQTIYLNHNISTFTVLRLLDLQAATNSVVDAIIAGNAAVSKISPIDTQGAIALSPIIMQLANNVNKTVANTIAHKEAFGGASPIVLNSLQVQQNLTLAFTLTTASKLPKALVGASATLSQPILQALSSGIAVFKKPNVNPKDSSVYTSAALASIPAQYAPAAFAAFMVLLAFMATSI